MNTKRLARRHGLLGLLGLNAALLGVLAVVTYNDSTTAQTFRARGQYHAVPITSPGALAGTLVIVDELNEQLIALQYNPNTKTLEGLGARDLAADASGFGRAR